MFSLVFPVHKAYSLQIFRSVSPLYMRTLTLHSRTRTAHGPHSHSTLVFTFECRTRTSRCLGSGVHEMCHRDFARAIASRRGPYQSGGPFARSATAVIFEGPLKGRSAASDAGL